MPALNKPSDGLRPIAVLIDAENVLMPDIIGGLIARLESFGTVGLMRVYGHHAALDKWKSVAMDFGVQPMLQFNPADKKNATDFALTIDAMDLLHSQRFGGFCLVTSDADFMPLVRRIRADGLPVYNCGESSKTKTSGKAYTECIAIESLVDTSPEKKSKPVKKPAAKTPVKAPAEKKNSKPMPNKQTLDRIREIVGAVGGKTDKIAMGALGKKLKQDFQAFNYKEYQHGTLGKFLAAYPDYFQIIESDGNFYVKLK
mgnify:CR=1 FL=1